MWLDAFSDTQATIYTFPNCVATADLVGDGDYRLIIADIGTGTIPSKLKVRSSTFNLLCSICSKQHFISYNTLSYVM